MIVDSHAHLVPPALLDDIRKRAKDFPSVALTEASDGSLAFSFCEKKQTRPISGPLRDVGGRLSWMNERGIDKQVVGGWLDMFGNELPPEEGEAWARLINDHFSRLAKEVPQFVPLATVPLQNGERSAAVLRDAVKDGFPGVMIGTQPKGEGGVLDDPDLLPFWEAADEIGAIVFIHPVFESGDSRVHEYGMANAVGRVTDSLIAISRLIFSGHITRFSNAKIIAGTGGAALPYVLGRLRRNYQLDPENLGDPDAALGTLYYDTILQDHRSLKFLADTVGVDRLMMGSDAPFPIGDPYPLEIVKKAGFSRSEEASINGGLAARLFGI